MMPIDWDATGSMLQGWATLAGAAAVMYAAKVGSNTFDAWKRQKQEERRMDAAEQILTLAYRLRHNLEAIRSPVFGGGELERAEERLKSDPDFLWNSLDYSRQRKARTAQAVKLRLAHFNKETQDVWTLKPTARAFFGPQVEQRLHDLWQCHVNVSVAADEYVDIEDDHEFATQLRRDLYKSGDPNPINNIITSAIEALERELMPVIRADGAPASPPTAPNS